MIVPDRGSDFPDMSAASAGIIFTIPRPLPIRSYWPDYAEFDITRRHVPDLLRIIDPDFVLARYRRTGEQDFFVNACCALAQMGELSAIEPIVRLVHRLRTTEVDSPEEAAFLDLSLSELMSGFGAAAVPVLLRYLRSADDDFEPLGCVDALGMVAANDASVREEVVSAVREELERSLRMGWVERAGSAIQVLIDTAATESVELIDHAVAKEPRLARIHGQTWDEIRERILQGETLKFEYELEPGLLEATEALLVKDLATRFSPPVGAIFSFESGAWATHYAEQIRGRHVPELIRIVDTGLARVLVDFEPGRRALGRAGQLLFLFAFPVAIEPLLRLGEWLSRKENPALWLWLYGDPRNSWCRFGPQIVDPILERIRDPEMMLSQHRVYVTTLAMLACEHDEHRERIIGGLVKSLLALREADTRILASLVVALIDTGEQELLDLLGSIVDDELDGMIGGWSWERVRGRVLNGQHPWKPNSWPDAIHWYHQNL